MIATGNGKTINGYMHKDYIKYTKNLKGVRREEDGSALCNELLCLGYGEGINQLDISSVNNGVRYLSDLTSQSKYGLVQGV